jgi:hypothetical protein
MRGAPVRAACLMGLAGALGLGACGAPGRDAAAPPTSRAPATTRTARPAPASPAAVGAAADRAAAYLRAQAGVIDPVSLTLVAWIGERFGRADLAALRTEAVRLVRVGERRGGSEVLDRIVDPAAPEPDPATVAAAGTDAVVHAGAFCTPGDTDGTAALARTVRAETRHGGYRTTHAALALVLAEQRGCSPDPDRRLRAGLVRRVAAELGARPEPSDLAFEQAAMLDLLDAWPRVPARSLVAAAVRAQRADGSWPWRAGTRPPQAEDWHPTMLGLWVLERSRGPGRPLPFLTG